METTFETKTKTDAMVKRVAQHPFLQGLNHIITQILRRSVALTLLLYVSAIAAILWPAIYEPLGWRITAWNCIVPTFGLLAVMFSSGKSSAPRGGAVIFATVAMLTVFAFVGAWAFTPLDNEPHSATTVIVFIYLPIVSLALAGAAYLIAQVNFAE